MKYFLPSRRHLALVSRRSLEVAYRIYWQRKARRRLLLLVRLLRKLEKSPSIYLIKSPCRGHRSSPACRQRPLSGETRRSVSKRSPTLSLCGTMQTKCEDSCGDGGGNDSDGDGYQRTPNPRGNLTAIRCGSGTRKGDNQSADGNTLCKH